MTRHTFFKKRVDNTLLKISNKSKINYFGRANSAIWCIASYLRSNSNKRTIILPSTMCISPAIIFKINGSKLNFIDVNIF